MPLSLATYAGGGSGTDNPAPNARTLARDAAVLVAGQQLSHAEAAAILGVAESTVSWRMHEVRRMIGGEN